MIEKIPNCKAVPLVTGESAQQAATPKYVSEKELANISGLSRAFWQKDRWLHRGKEPGCPFISVGRTVRYDLEATLEWLRNACTNPHGKEAHERKKAEIAARAQSAIA